MLDAEVELKILPVPRRRRSWKILLKWMLKIYGVKICSGLTLARDRVQW